MIRTAEEDQREAVREHQASLLKADEVILREAILDVIDKGCTQHNARNYLFWGSDREFVKNERLDFARAVVARVQQLKQIDEEMTNDK